MFADLTRLKALAGKATPGPWRAAPKKPHELAVRLKKESVSVYGPESLIYTMPRDYGTLRETWLRQKADAEFIAACSPETILALCERVERVEAMTVQQGERASRWFAEGTRTDEPLDYDTAVKCVDAALGAMEARSDV